MQKLRPFSDHNYKFDIILIAPLYFHLKRSDVGKDVGFLHFRDRSASSPAARDPRDFKSPLIRCVTRHTTTIPRIISTNDKAIMFSGSTYDAVITRSVLEQNAFGGRTRAARWRTSIWRACNTSNLPHRVGFAASNVFSLSVLSFTTSLVPSFAVQRWKHRVARKRNRKS